MALEIFVQKLTPAGPLPDELEELDELDELDQLEELDELGVSKSQLVDTAKVSASKAPYNAILLIVPPRF
jgi:hypothetical protein